MKQQKTPAIKNPPVLPTTASEQATVHFLGVQESQVQILDLPKSERL